LKMKMRDPADSGRCDLVAAVVGSRKIC
jgi:hypothetical protein